MCYVGILHYHRETAMYSWLKLRFQVQKCYSCELIMYHVSSRLSLIQRFVGLSPVSLWYFILWLWVKAPPGWYPIAGIYRKWRNRAPILPRFRKCSVSCISYSIIYFIDLEYVPLYHVYTHYKYTHTNIYINIYICTTNQLVITIWLYELKCHFVPWFFFFFWMCLPYIHRFPKISRDPRPRFGDSEGSQVVSPRGSHIPKDPLGIPKKKKNQY